MGAIQEWRERIRAHHAQTARAHVGRPGHADIWSGIADRFRDDPRREDPVIDAVAPWLTPDTTVLDVGGGAGRYALPMALRCKHVTVVEPSQAMTEALLDSAKEAGIANVSAVASTWEDADVEPADVSFCANVVYGVSDIEPFVRKLEDRTRQVVSIVVFMDAPLSRISPFWKAVYDEERIDMPALPELLGVLWEMGIYPNVTMLPPMPPRSMPDKQSATAFARHMLYVDPGTEADKRLLAAIDRDTEETADGFRFKQWAQRPPGVVWWRVG